VILWCHSARSLIRNLNFSVAIFLSSVIFSFDILIRHSNVSRNIRRAFVLISASLMLKGEDGDIRGGKNRFLRSGKGGGELFI